MRTWTNLLLPNDATLGHALRMLDEAHTDFLVVADNAQKLVGVLEDIDIRKALLAGYPLDKAAATVAKEPSVHGKAASNKYSIVLNDRNEIVEIRAAERLTQPARSDNTVVLMVGGAGLRLRPLTTNCPKPLLPIHGEPLLERTIKELAGQGFHKIILTVSYKSEMITTHFKDGSHWNVEISYIHEKQRLGTCGALGLLSELPSEPLVVMNGDVITDLKLANILSFHRQTGALVTVGLHSYPIHVPYGVVEYEGTTLTAMHEKPIISRWISAGIYVLSPSALNLIPRGRFFDMPTLLQTILAGGDTVSTFPLYEHWMDIGSIEEYRRANKILDLEQTTAVACPPEIAEMPSPL